MQNYTTVYCERITQYHTMPEQKITSAFFPAILRAGKTLKFPNATEIVTNDTNLLYRDDITGNYSVVRSASISLINLLNMSNFNLSDNTRILLEPSKYEICYTYECSCGVEGTPVTVKYTYSFSTVEYTLPPKKYTITDAINRILELAEPLYGTQKPRFHLDGITYNNDGTKSIAAGSQAEEFDKIMSPDFTMTRCNLLEKLKIIGGFIHAQPRLRGDTIFFDKYGGTEEATTLIGKEYVSQSFHQHINEYCTELDVTAENLVNGIDGEGSITEPDKGNYNTLRTETTGIRIEDGTGSGVVLTQFPINGAPKVKCGIYNEDGTWALEPVDISPYVFEKAAYDARLSSYGGTYPYAKNCAIYYAQGTNNIGGLFWKDPKVIAEVYNNYSIINIIEAVTGESGLSSRCGNNYALLAFQLTYTPIYGMRLSHGKPFFNGDETRYARVYNQSENLINSSSFGENVKGAAARLGNADERRTYILKSLNDVPKCGQVFEGKYISGITMTVMPDYVKCTIDLSSDFNRLSQYIGVDQSKRVFEVSEKQAYERSILLKSYVVITDKTPVLDDTLLIMPTNEISQIGKTLLGQGGNPINYVIAERKKTLGGAALSTIKLPVVAAPFGNTINFSWQHRDNYSAGVAAEKVNSDTSTLKGYWSKDVPYGDEYGRLKYYDFYLCQETKTQGFDKALDLPLVTDDFTAQKAAAQISTRNTGSYLMQKDSREVIKMNVSVELKTDVDGLIIGSGFAKNCPFVATPKPCKLYALTHRVDRFASKIDESLEGVPCVDIEVIPETILGEKIGEIIRPVGNSFPGASGTEYKAWVIATEQTTTTKNVCNDDGTEVQQTYTEGGDILLARNIDFYGGDRFNSDGEELKDLRIVYKK